MKILVWESSHHHIIRKDLFKICSYKLCTTVWSHLKHAVQFLSMCFFCTNNALNRPSSTFSESHSWDASCSKYVQIKRVIVHFLANFFLRLTQALVIHGTYLGCELVHSSVYILQTRSQLCYTYIIHAQKVIVCTQIVVIFLLKKVKIKSLIIKITAEPENSGKSQQMYSNNPLRIRWTVPRCNIHSLVMLEGKRITNL